MENINKQILKMNLEQERENTNMNTTTIKILEIKKAEIRERQADKSKYARITFLGKDKNDLDINIKSSMSVEQFKELSKAMVATYDKENDTISVKQSLSLEVDLTQKTKGDKPKSVFKQVVAEYQGFPVNYWDMNVLVLINNKIVSPSKFIINNAELFA